VRKHILTASAALAFLIAAACGQASSVSPAASGAAECVNPKAAHRAYVVVTHLDGRTVQKCVGFAGAQVGGDDLMKQSGVEMQTQQFSFGSAVCQLDSEPAQFSECLPKNGPYWALWVWSGSAWQPAQTGYTAISLGDGQALGWRYTPATASPAPQPPAPRK